MEIIISRHAKRRGKLYGISENVIIDILSEMELTDGHQEFIKVVAGYKYPWKIVVHVSSGKATVITTYPLKKGRKK